HRPRPGRPEHPSGGHRLGRRLPEGNPAAGEPPRAHHGPDGLARRQIPGHRRHGPPGPGVGPRPGVRAAPAPPPVPPGPRRRSLAVGSADGRVVVWEMASGAEVCSYEGKQGEAVALGFSPDGSILASGGCDCTVLLWDLTGLWSEDRRPDRPDRIVWLREAL